MSLKHCICILLFFSSFILSGQEIKGKVIDDTGEAIPGALVKVLDKPGTYTLSKSSGTFAIKTKRDTLILEVSFLGYQPVRKNSYKNKDNVFVLSFSSKQLKAVEISGTSNVKHSIRSVQSISAIDVMPLQVQSVAPEELINRTAGVKVKSDGGLGTFSDVNINGISGKGIKYFLDGVPLDNVGYSAAINLIPVNLINRIEIYKGITPVSLGADALGGGINIVTRQEFQDFLDVGIEHFSFNSTRSNLSFKKYFKHDIYLSSNSYFNYSENNFEVSTTVRKDNGKLDSLVLPHFHDEFKNYNLNLNLGKRFNNGQDLVELGFTNQFFYKEIQHRLGFMDRVYGAPFLRESGNKLFVNLKKQNWFKTGIATQLYVMRYKGLQEIIDTSAANYNWRGEVVSSAGFGGGELSPFPHSVNLNTTNDLLRFNAEKSFNKNHAINFNVVYTQVNQVGEDTAYFDYIKAFGVEKDPYSNPQFLEKWIGGLSYEYNFWNERVKVAAFSKYFQLRAQSVAALFDLNPQPISKYYSRLGFGFQSNVALVENRLYVKLGYEDAARLPDQYELFGDRALIIPNPELKPEQSKNTNLELTYRNDKYWKSTVTTRFFNRDSKDFIRLVPGQSFAQYQNLPRVVSKGAEIELSTMPLPFVRLNFNATYGSQTVQQDTTDLEVNKDLPQKYFGEEVPNRPMYFAYMGVQFFKPSLIKKGDLISLYFNSNYTPSFFVNWEIDGRADSKIKTPVQWFNDLGISYNLPQRKLYASFEVKNMFKINRFDNFGAQGPGRSFHIKIGAFIKKS